MKIRRGMVLKNVDKTLIKVIKRNDAEKTVAANAKTRGARGKKKNVAMSEEKPERNPHRRIANTISNWISERRENKRAEENSLIRRMFAEELFPGKPAR